MTDKKIITSVVVSIPCFNEEKYIFKCLNSIVNSSYPKGLLDVYVVDGMSTDNTVSIINEFTSKYSYIHLLTNVKRITPVSINMGLKAKNADVKILLGAHSEIDSDFITNSVSNLHDIIDAGCVGGIIYNVNENKVANLVAIAMSSPFGVGNARFRTGGKDGYVDTVAFGAYRKTVFDEIGYFDEDLVRNQDDEFNYRLIKAGYKIWFTNTIQSKYYVRSSFKKLSKQYYQYGYWKVFVSKRYNNLTSWRQLAPPVMVLTLISLALVSILSVLVFQLFVFTFSFYLLTGLLIGIRKTKNLKSSLGVLMVFLILHFSYGLGYLKGIFDFIILNKKPTDKAKEISR